MARLGKSVDRLGVCMGKVAASCPGGDAVEMDYSVNISLQGL